MIVERSEQTPGARFLVVAAAGVVVIWGLRYLAPILLPFSLALFASVLTLPILAILRNRGVPSWIAILVAMSVVVGVASLLITTATASISELQGNLPVYSERLGTIQNEWITSLADRSSRLEENEIRDYLSSLNLLEPERMIEFAGGLVGRAASILSQAFIVLIIMVFVLAEAIVLPGKLEAILGTSVTGEERIGRVVGEVQQYLGIKTLVSLATGLVIGIWCWAMGLDFPVLLGLIAFTLNYIPTIGSIIAGVPAVALSLVIVGSFSHALFVAAGYAVVNTVFGNFIEPSLLGRRLGLSTLVVILSLLFWGWTWGPIGALLSVPLTMIVKIWLENNEDLRWIAVLLGKQAPAVESRADDGSSPALAAD